MNKQIVKQFYDFAYKAKLSKDVVDEMAIPSYNHYNPLVRWVFFKRLDKIIKNIDFNNKTVLDFGCGTGILFEKYVSANKIYACDLHSEVAKETAKALNITVEFIGKIDDLPDESIDLAIFADVLEHIENYAALILKVKSKLNKHGLILVSIPTESIFYKLCRIIAGYGCNVDYHRANPKDIISFLNKVFKNKEKINFPRLFAFFRIIEYTKYDVSNKKLNK